MSKIEVIRQASDAEIAKRGIRQWPTWGKQASKFPWTYDDSETCYFLEGDVIVTPKGGEPVRMGKGDIVTFPAGMSCTWEILADVRKHYNFF
ncbi:MAG: cupin domain-containing protein [Gammaproteobacteria bacterium]|nr:cupin domain-containing protein [Gammaproteobacteria bacterium]